MLAVDEQLPTANPQNWLESGVFVNNNEVYIFKYGLALQADRSTVSFPVKQTMSTGYINSFISSGMIAHFKPMIARGGEASG